MSALSPHSHRAAMQRPVPAAALVTDPSRVLPSHAAHGDMPPTIDRNRLRLQRYRASHPGFSTAKNRRWQAANPEKRRAHRTVETALRNGTLVRGPCATCGTTQRVEAHHEDYARALDVTWFCRRHHHARHCEMAAEAAVAALLRSTGVENRRPCHV